MDTTPVVVANPNAWVARGHHLGGIGAAHDRRRAPIDHRVEETPGPLVVFLSGAEDGAPDGSVEALQVGV
jgi:hypothetical protein